MKLRELLTTAAVIVVLCVFPTYAADILVDENCSLADAIQSANNDDIVGGCAAGNGADVISLSADVTLDTALTHITTRITVEGNDFTISGNNQFRVFAVYGGDLLVRSLTITDGKADWGGAVAIASGWLEMEDSTISGSWASEGGGIGNAGNVSIIDSTISGNSAGDGGAIHSVDGIISIWRSTVVKNASEGKGGALSLVNGSAIITESNVSNNSSQDDGGAIFNGHASLSVTKSVLNENQGGRGGAIYNDRGSIDIVDSVFHGNTGWSGGAIHHLGRQSHIERSRFVQNMTRGNTGDGGAIYISRSSELAISNSYFSGNWAREKGGAIADANGYAVEITNSSIVGNSADEHGGGIFSRYGRLKVDNTTIQGNSAKLDGGGVYLGDMLAHDNWKALFRFVTVANNSAITGGGLFKFTGTDVALEYSIIAKNLGGDCYGRLAENVGNLIEDSSCFPQLSGDPKIGDLTESKELLRPFIPLLEGSQAIDAVPCDDSFQTEQIGTPRPRGEGCDIGAIEFVPEQ